MLYELRALTLIVEERTCKACKKTHRVASNLMLKLEAKGGPVNGKKFHYTKPRVNSLELDLPRELKEVKTEVEVCEECFAQAGTRRSNASLDDQLDLFLEKPKAKYELEGLQVGTAGILHTLKKVREVKKPEKKPEPTGLEKLAMLIAAE